MDGENGDDGRDELIDSWNEKSGKKNDQDENDGMKQDDSKGQGGECRNERFVICNVQNNKNRSHNVCKSPQYDASKDQRCTGTSKNK